MTRNSIGRKSYGEDGGVGSRENDGGDGGRGLHFRQGTACAKPPSGGL